MRKYFELFLLIVVMGFVAYAKTAEQAETPYVILISFDGFRHDYVEKFDTPNFKEFIAQGAAAESMQPSFPSKTFPNHYSIVTGMYPGSHGLVDNSFFDRELDVKYTIGNRELVENPAFYGGLPLWQLVQHAGMKSASYFWVGSETPIAGRFPDYYHIYNGKVPNEERIDAVVDWLKLPEEDRPNFISLYFSLVDSQGHATGPNSEETRDTVLEADRLLGLLMDQLKEVDLPVNVIITSDHGMNTVPETEETLIAYEDVLVHTDPGKYRFVNNGAHGHFYVHDSTDIDELYSQLAANAQHFKVFKKPELPEKWHFQHERVGEIFITMEPGHYLTSKFRKKVSLARGKNQGQHGFDPAATPDMGAIFYANGPNIKAGATIDSFENVHVYPFIAHILGISQWPEIDGELSVLLPLYVQ